ncbi:antibiotic biosynthesis monooxygenase family protein [Roseovarius sp. C7]|uniref:antibiotic biosynthesis monooxygenase family protein n=1 Tax=Roseovarius sp. C7 TaxID=3398643 RepID=UPI0039F6B861
MKEKDMRVSQDAKVQTVITTYEVTPGTYLDLLEELRKAFDGFIRVQDGFVAGAVHTNDAQTRIANYTQWQTREQFLNVLRSEEMRRMNRKFSELSKGFEPVLYEVHASFDAEQ